MSSRTTHHYSAELHWEPGAAGTVDYERYSRRFAVLVEGKPPLAGSADAAFRGDPRLHNPEDLLLAAVASCHMLSYLALCARRRIVVTAYRDHAEGVLALEPHGGGQFTSITLHPRVTLAAGTNAGKALALHEQARRICFIAASCGFPIHHRAEVVVAGGAGSILAAGTAEERPQ